MKHTSKPVGAFPTRARRGRAGLAGLALTLLIGGCSGGDAVEAVAGRQAALSGGHQRPSTEQPVGSCGFQAETGTYATWPGGYLGWVTLTNVDGPTATDFEVLLDVGDTTIRYGFLAEYEEVEGGYSVTAPSWLRWQKIRPGRSYQFQFLGSGKYRGAQAYVVSINGELCDPEPPEISLSASAELFTEVDTLTLTADAVDNVAVRRVEFAQDGEVIGVDDEAPYTLDLDVTEELNGRHVYTATAFDPSGNEATGNPVRVLVAIDNKFFGTAPGGPEDYTHLLEYFDQLTPENAGKWGSVEAARDEMDFADLDTAYEFAHDNGLRFKLHTLVWGQQQPGWLSELEPAEQLEEIDEWMAALAEQYPDLEMIDVVNEPMHAPPAYAEALGGDGETGWDWVIQAFEMAREHFPNSQLILNDYNVLILENFTQDYLQIIDVLQERGLIDGIGVQAHFLERAEIPVVAANLDTLAATGLPIYVSELDLNFANDARQANVMRDLFTVFWNHPAVVGVTHWGHLQGSTFRPDAYLVRSDDTTRPALDWLMCFIGGGDDCTVPEYVPEPWVGTESGITLQAEAYDTAEGLAALGNTVAYTDDGDYLGYSQVEFQENWDTFSVSYTKGNEDVGSISVYVDSLENDPAATVVLPPTAGWGSSETIDVPWAPLAGSHDIVVRFNDVEGVANVDWIRFGAPAGQGPNLISDSDFESGTGDWYTWSDATLTNSAEQALTGTQSLLLTDRIDNGVVAIDLTSGVTAGSSYQLSLWVTIGGAAEAETNVVQKLSCLDDPDGNPYSWVVNPTPVAEGEWVELSAQIQIPESCNIGQLQYHLEGPPAGVDLYVDHASFRLIEPQAVVNLVANGDFETDATSWYTWGTGTLAVTDERAHGGAQSLALTGRTNNSPLVTDLAGVEAGGAYPVSFWVSIAGAAQADVNITQKVSCVDELDEDEDGATDDLIDHYSWLVSPTTIPEDEWVELRGTLVVNDCNVAGVSVYAEGAQVDDVYADIFIDDVTVLATAPGNLLTDGDFESGLGSWSTWDGTLAISTDLFHGGAQSVVNTGSTGGGPIVRSLTSLFSPGDNLNVSLWATITGQPEAQVHITRKFECADPEEQVGEIYSWIAGPVNVAEGEWVELSGSETLPDCALADVLVYAEKEDGLEVDLYVDDAVVTK